MERFRDKILFAVVNDDPVIEVQVLATSFTLLQYNTPLIIVLELLLLLLLWIVKIPRVKSYQNQKQNS